ncbi:MAG: hypothetical protein AAF789_09005 [Bacteroidota bacterium]
MTQSSNRPFIESIRRDLSVNDAEKLQNETIRPIVKKLHSLLMQHLAKSIASKGTDFKNYSPEQQRAYLEKFLTKDQSMINQIKGMILGHFSHEEFTLFYANRIETGKRMIAIVRKRAKEHLTEIAAYM